MTFLPLMGLFVIAEPTDTATAASPSSKPGDDATETAPAAVTAADGSTSAATTADDGGGGEDQIQARDAAEEDDAEGDETKGEYYLTEEGVLAGLQWDGSSNLRPNRRPTREEKGGYIDNEEFQDEVRSVATG